MFKRQTLLSWCFSALILSLPMAFINSCTLVQQLPIFPEPAEKTQAFAEQLFINGDFERAILEYEQIYETAFSLEDKNHALYGLACTQMMLASNADQLIEAINNLQKWDASKGTAPFKENRHLLILALKQQGVRIEEQNNALIERENQQNSLIANQQLKIAQLLTNIEKLQNQTKELQNQLEALEALDENVQKKRKSL